MRRALVAGVGTLFLLAACGRHVQDGPLSAVSGNTVVNGGDINGDGIVDHKDILLAQRISLGQITASADQLARGDTNADGRIDVSDYLLIQRKVLGL